MHACQNLVEKVDFFRDLPSGLLVRIVKGMKSEIYLTNDVIVKAGIIGDSMYFIASGTIAVYTSSGKEVSALDLQFNSFVIKFFTIRFVIWPMAVISAKFP